VANQDRTVLLTLPAGEEIENPSVDLLTNLLLHADQKYWEYQSGTVGISFGHPKSSDYAELVLVMRDPPGVYLQHTAADGRDEYCLSAGTDDTVVVAHLGGESLELPARQVVPRALALRAVLEFTRSGKRAPDLTWDRI
jgi:hypothetical protein